MGRNQTEADRKRNSEAVKNLWANPEYRRKQLERNATPETFLKKSTVHKRIWADPVYKKEMLAKLQKAQKKNHGGTHP